MRTYATILPGLRSALRVGVCLLLTVPAYAVDTLQVTTPDPITEAWRWTEFDRSSGIAGVSTEIFEDRDGIIWFATSAGVQRYDGWTFETFTKEDGLASNYVASIAQTRDGAMWFGTDAGISRYDGQDWKTYTTEEGLASDNASPPGNSLFEARDGTLWAGFRGTGDVSRLPPGKQAWETIATPLSDTSRAQVTSIIQSSDGDLWFAAFVGVLRLDRSSQSWQHYSSQDGLGVDFPVVIMQAADGTIYAGGRGGGVGRGGLSRFDGTRWWRVDAEDDGLGALNTNRIWQTDAGTIQGFGNGFYKLEGDRWRRYRVPGGSGTAAALPASDGSLWTFSSGVGAFRFTPDDLTWTVFSDVPVTWMQETSASDNLFVLDDEVWVGGGDGAARLEGDAWIKYTSEDGLFDGPVNTIVKAADGAIWFAGADESGSVAARFDPRVQDGGAWRRFTREDGLVGENISAGLAATNGDIWYGTKSPNIAVENAGVARYDGRDWTVYSQADGLLHSRIYRLAEGPNGHIWVGTLFGLNRFDSSASLRTGGQTWTSFLPFPDQPPGQFQKIRALSTTIDVWTGTAAPDGGAAIYDGQNWTSFTTDEGLSHDGVWAIYQSRDGTVWAGTPAGLSRYDETGWSSYAGENGPDSIRARSIAETSDGAIWIRGSRPGSVMRHIPDRNPPETHHLPAIDQVSSAGNILLQWSGGDYYNDTPVDRLRYQYRVDDGNWSQSTNRRGLTFTSLDDGDHRIEVRAVDWSGNVDATPAVHAFIVEGPWWKNPYLAVSGLVMLALIGLQTGRLVRRDQRLRASNQALSDANNQLFTVNRDLEMTNVDLQREQVLERLRGQAQGMQSSEDIGPVAEAVYKELTALGLPLKTSGISIYISEVKRELWQAYEGGRVLPRIMERIDEIRESGLRGDNYFHRHTEGEEVKERLRRSIESGNPLWKDVPEERWPQQDDHYVVHFEGGSVGLHSEEPIAEEYLMLIKRFGEVFGYAHSRREELKEKEAQNRELTVEAALERVRARALGMQESTDLGNVAKVLFDEMVNLGFEATRSAITTTDITTDTWTNWWGEVGRGVVLGSIAGQLSDMERVPWVAAWRQGEAPYHLTKRSREEVEEREGSYGILPESEKERKAYLDLFEKGQFHYFFFFKQGWLSPVLTRELSDEDIHVAERFAQVFGLAYDRFDELQQKEAQNRQLITEAALERVRSSVTSMTAAADLGGVVEQMLKELETSGVDFDLCVINIIDEGAGVRRQYGATPQGWSGQVEMPLSEVSEGFLALWREGKPVAREVDDALAEACFETRSQMGVTGEMVRPTAVVDAPFAYGTLSLQTHKTEGLSEGDIDVVAEFARVVALGYARYLDFANLERQNQELQRDRAVERIRGEVQSMERAEDFERVLSLLTEDLKTVGLDFESCEIDVLEEPVDNPTTQFFEEKGFRYTTYTLNPDGHVASEPFAVSAPFPGVIRQTVERFVAGEPWQGTSEGQAIVEVPAGSYGRLRLTATGRDSFDDDEVASLKQFSDAVALGYARYLDIREIQEATEKKSAFLASMSHELRTPMNAIKGFTNVVLRRIGREIPDQQRENLEKVDKASDHLLGMINDLLDLSKIEAGRMDVEATTFNVEEMITSSCDTVSPLIQEGVELRQDVADDIGEANTDKARLQQMVINLLSNAIKFTDSGSVTVSAATEDGQLVIAVSDTGKGIPADELPTIFDEYRQAEGSESAVQKGTGLGLSITKKFAELLGGTIGVESEVGRGSTFTVKVPVEYRTGEEG